MVFEPAIGGNISPPAPSQHHQPVNNMMWTPSRHDHQQLETIPFGQVFSTMLNSNPHKDESYTNATKTKSTSTMNISKKERKKQKRERKRLYKYLSRAKQPTFSFKHEEKSLELERQDILSTALDTEASIDDHLFEVGELSDETLFESLNQDFSL